MFTFLSAFAAEPTGDQRAIIRKAIPIVDGQAMRRCGTMSESKETYRISMLASRWLIPWAYLVVYVIWGSTYLAIRFGIETMSPSLLFGYRFLLAGLINLALYRAWGLARRQPPERLTTRRVANASLIGCVLLIGGTGLVGWAEYTVDSHVAALIISSTPLWVTVIDSILRRQMLASPLQVAGMILGVLGVAILTGVGAPDQHASRGSGVALLLLAAFFWSAASSSSHLADLPSDILLTSAIQMFAGGAGFVLIGFVLGEIDSVAFTAVSAKSWWAMWYLALFGSCVAFTAFAWLLTVEPVHRVASYALVNPFVAVALGAWWGGETITNRVWIALPIISLGLALHLFTPRPAAKAAQPDAPLPQRGAP
jgi:drug/metabolite transporter (DMT)-like permease